MSVAAGVEVVMVVTLGFDVEDGETVDIATVCVTPLGPSVETLPVGPVTIVKVTTVAPGMSVAEFGSVVTTERLGGTAVEDVGIVLTMLDGFAGELPGRVTMLVAPGETVITIGLPALLIGALDGPLDIVTTLGPFPELGAVLEIVAVDPGLLGGSVVIPVAVEVVATLGLPLSVVVRPDGPPRSVTTKAALVTGSVTMLLPLAGTVIRLRPPGTVVVTPEGPPEIVVRTAPLLTGTPWVTVLPPDVALGATKKVRGLPFGSVVTVPLPHVGEGEPRSLGSVSGRFGCMQSRLCKESGNTMTLT